MLTERFELPAGTERLPAVCALLEERVLAACNEQFAGERSETGPWTSCRPLDVLYDPGQQVRLAVALCEESDVSYERLWARGQIVSLVHPVREPMSRRGRIIRIDGHPFEAYLFPNDRRLRALRNVASIEALERLWTAWFGESVDLRRRFIRYVPEQKFITRLRPSSRTGTLRGPLKGIALRMTRPDLADEMIRRHRIIARQTDASKDVLHVPRVLGADAEKGLMAIKWISGDMLLDVLRQEDAGQVMPRVVAAIRRFHDLAIDDLPAVTPDSLATSLDASVTDLMTAVPAEADHLRNLADRWHASVSSLGDTPCVTLHNDFFWGQVRRHHDRYTLLDLERMAVGDPLLDIANFAQELEALAFRDELSIDAEQAAGWAEMFREAWTDQTGTSIDPLRYGIYASMTALRMARGMMRHLRPGWQSRLGRYVDAAESALDQIKRGEVVR